MKTTFHPNDIFQTDGGYLRYDYTLAALEAATPPDLVEALRAASDALCVMLERSPAPESVIDAMSRVTAVLAELEGGE